MSWLLANVSELPSFHWLGALLCDPWLDPWLRQIVHTRLIRFVFGVREHTVSGREVIRCRVKVDVRETPGFDVDVGFFGEAGGDKYPSPRGHNIAHECQALILRQVLEDIATVHQVHGLDSLERFVPVLGQWTRGAIPVSKHFIGMMAQAFAVSNNHLFHHVQSNVKLERVGFPTVKDPIRITTGQINHGRHIVFGNGLTNDFHGRGCKRSQVTPPS